MRERLAEVKVPTLILHGARDRVCSVANAERVRALLGTRDVRVVILPRSRHIITRDLERETVARELRGFFRRI
jgi:esterase/lipase